jgi:hypothetical protein
MDSEHTVIGKRVPLDPRAYKTQADHAHCSGKRVTSAWCQLAATLAWL